ncbi:hypothetical protein [Bacillus nitratireducens]|uniref:hypothetical protein n=1 Tax=Bacillus nitratireducens TaxID=2026193 RepID=UPI002E1BE2A2|nr:hypothetical protein [Bacillus nitratireducens]
MSETIELGRSRTKKKKKRNVNNKSIDVRDIFVEQKESKNKKKKEWIFFFYVKENILLVSSIVAIILIALLIQWKFYSGINSEFVQSLIPNIIVDMGSIIFSCYLITYLVNKNQEKREKSNLYRVVGYDYLGLIESLVPTYLFVISRDTRFLDLNYEPDTYLVLKKINNKKVYIAPSHLNDEVELNPLTYEEFMEWSRNTRLSRYLEIIETVSKMIEKQLEENEISSALLVKAWESEDRKKLEHYKTVLNTDPILNDIFEAAFHDEFNELGRKILQGKDGTGIDADITHKFYKTIINNSPLFQPIREEFHSISQIKYSEIYLDYYNCFNEKVKGFYEKYDIIIPLDLRQAFSEIEYYLNYSIDNFRNETKNDNENAFVNLSRFYASKNVIKQYLYLLEYFKDYDHI